MFHKGRELEQTSICELGPVVEVQRGEGWEELGQVTKRCCWLVFIWPSTCVVDSGTEGKMILCHDLHTILRVVC